MASSMQPFYILMMTWTTFPPSAPPAPAQMAEKIEKRGALIDDNLSTRQ